MQPKPAGWQSLTEARNEMNRSDRRSPWTCVNNCTVQKSNNNAKEPICYDTEQPLSMTKGEFLTKLDAHRDKLTGLGVNLSTEDQIRLLIGGQVYAPDGSGIRFENGKLQFLV